MTALATAARAVPYVSGTNRMGKTYGMWPLGKSGHETYRQALCASSLDDAVKIATPPMAPLDVAKGGWPPFVILETDDRARPGKAQHVLHFYIVKAKREFRAVGEFGTAKKVAIPYAIHQGSLPMEAFEPRRPFDPMRDCRITGAQPGEAAMIEARR
jgi:hypothetical protein